MKFSYSHLLFGALVMAATMSMASCQSFPYADSPQAGEDKFENAQPRRAPDISKTFDIYWDFLFNKPANTVPHAPIPVQILSRGMLATAPDRSLFRIGHSTVLLKLNGDYFLTDPVFSERASPVQWIAPKRFHAPPIAVEEHIASHWWRKMLGVPIQQENASVMAME